MRTHPGRLAAAATAAALTLTAACTAGSSGSDQSDSGPKADAQQTIEVWHGWSADHEVKAFDEAVAGFRKAHPNITVKLVKDQTDDRITNAIRGGNPPDVVSSFTTDSVGQWCQSGAWQDLAPYVAKSKLDLNQFPKAVQEYTQYKGRRCAMPLLADTYGLYYNKALMKGEQPPKTMSELTALAKKLTKRKPDGTIEVAGFMPSVQYYEHVPQHMATQFGVKWLNDQGKANFSKDPAFKAYLQWNKSLIDWYGYDNVKKFLRSMGQEFESSNPFEKGKVAMAVDGEWRTKFIQEEAPKLDYGTAPIPVADSKPDLYGAGYLSGTIIGIPKTTKSPNAAWELVKYLTTDTDALVSFSNAIHNVPSTLEALKSPALEKDENFQTFFKIAEHPKSITTPASANGGKYQVDFQNFGYDYEAGKVKDLAAGLKAVDKKIDDQNALSQR